MGIDVKADISMLLTVFLLSLLVGSFLLLFGLDVNLLANLVEFAYCLEAIHIPLRCTEKNQWMVLSGHDWIYLSPMNGRVCGDACGILLNVV